MLKPLATFVGACLMSAGISTAHAVDFFDTGAPERFIELGVHAFAGTSSLLQNYSSKYPSISSLQMSPGVAYGVGGKGELGIRNWLGINTEFNVMMATNSLALTVAAAGAPVSTNYVDNRRLEFNIPVYVTVHFNLADNVRWNMQCGFYYALGLWGRQKQHLYTSYINDLGQLIDLQQHITSGYYNDAEAFIDSSRRSDWGLFLGTSFDLGRRVTAGVRYEMSIRNIANVTDSGIERPGVRNISLLAAIGWRF